MAIVRGFTALKDLADALGITFPVSKIVLECQAGGPVRAYVVALLREKPFQNVVELLNQQGVEILPVADVNVDEKGVVTLKDKPSADLERQADAR